MQTKPRNISFFPVVAIFFLLLSACGGDGGGSDGGAVTPSATISGAVSGTTVVAIDSQDKLVASDNTSDKTVFDVDTDGDGITDAFSFTLTGLPLGENLRVFLITGGAIYPMYFDTDGDGVSDSNVFSLDTTSSTTLELGFVEVEPFGETGRAIPEINPFSNSNVVVGTAIAEIPESVNEPSTSGLTVAELNVAGLKALSDGWVLGARTYFDAAVVQAGSDTSNDADTARFFFALVRVAALGFDTLSDGDATLLERLGDVLDRLGAPNDETRANWGLLILPDTLPANSPTGNEYRNFLYTVVGGELTGALDNLADISTAFNADWSEPFVNDTPLESDYGDVLFFRSLFGSALATLAIQRSYELDADIDAIDAQNDDLDPTNDVTIETFLSGDLDFLTLADASKLQEAKATLQADALVDMNEAINVILAETDDQNDDLITLVDPADPLADQTLQEQELRDFQDRIAEVQNSIANGATSIGTSNPATLDLMQFFNSGVDFRDPNRLPEFTGNDVAGLFPDPGFNSVVLSPDLNEDIVDANGFPGSDGIPDIVQ
ncbi:MAG: hypothetical protein PVI91_06625 [Gammaproteobacteria bacterium]|jgi:hypothetical protein